MLQASQTPPGGQAKVEARLMQLSQDVQGLAHRLNPKRSHISHFLSHPKVIAPNVTDTSARSLCPVCDKLFDSWSGQYTLACDHYYHLV